MTIEFCSYMAVAKRLNAGSFSGLVSILGAEDSLEWPSVAAAHLRLTIDDIAAPMRGYSLASAAQIADLLRFGARHESVLIHCRAGTSRSAAAAILLELQYYQPCLNDIEQLVAHFRERFPFSRPNQRIIECGDASLGLQQHLIAAVKKIFT